MIWKKLKFDPLYEPCLIEENDEYMPNGIFVFNITKVNEYAIKSENNVPVLDYNISSFDSDVNLDEYQYGEIVASNPGIIAEIAPGWYNLLDGRHRATKIKQAGGTTFKCFQFSVMEHIKFLSSIKEDLKRQSTYLGFVFITFRLLSQQDEMLHGRHGKPSQNQRYY